MVDDEQPSTPSGPTPPPPPLAGPGLDSPLSPPPPTPRVSWPDRFARLKASGGTLAQRAWTRGKTLGSSLKTRWKSGPWPARVQKSNDWIRARVVEPVKRKAEQWHLGDRFRKALPDSVKTNLPKSYEPLVLAEWAGKLVQKQGAGFYGTAATIVLSTYFAADLTSLWIESFVPEPPPQRATRTAGRSPRMQRSLSDYDAIFSRNLFNSLGLIPGEEMLTPGQDLGGTPIKTSLPFTLIGTMILRDETRSIATIEDKSASLVYPVRVEDEIPAKARILSVESHRVVFVNLSSGRREYVDLPLDPIVSNPRITIGKPSTSIEQTSPTQFNVSRTEVDKAVGNLNEVLTQARCVPNFENGLPAGYKCFQIVPGSIYDKLGMKNGDVICGINGEGIDNPAKAFELFGNLKTANHLELCIKRDGRQQTFNYDIR